MAEADERLDLIITPEGTLAYTSAADAAHAAALADAGRKRRDRPEAEGGGGTAAAGSGTGDASEATAAVPPPPPPPAPASVLDVEDRVNLSSGKFKYACLRLVREGEPPLLAVRSARGSYHADVAEPAMDAYEAMGFRCEPLGGGRIVRDDAARTVHIYGYSVGFGGAEGGPPGHGMQDHAEVAALVRRAMPAYTVTYDSAGY